MLILDKQTQRELTILESVSSELQNQVSKLASRRLHLQSLIAKRDRLDYEIRVLKRRIQEDKKAKTKMGQRSIKENAISFLESYQENDPEVFQNPLVSRKLTEVRANLAQLADEEVLLNFLEELPRITE